MTTTAPTRADKKVIREQLRSLRDDLKTWTLKAPSPHPEIGAVCHEHRSWRRGITAGCEACCFVAFRVEKADEVRTQIRSLTRRLKGDPEPAPTRKATVITGRGEQLVMFV
jgi:hypothetical protein